MADTAALIDANVFYTMAATDIILETARAGLIRAHWTDLIHDEWINGLHRNEPSRTRDILERRRRAMDAAVRDALVTGFEHLIPTLTLPDPNDRHVLAAAIISRCDLIVTFNLRDFPNDALASHGIAAVHPDAFLIGLMDAQEGAFLACVKTTRTRMKNPPRTPEEHVARLARVGLTRLAARLGGHTDTI